MVPGPLMSASSSPPRLCSVYKAGPMKPPWRPNNSTSLGEHSSQPTSNMTCHTIGLLDHHTELITMHLENEFEFLYWDLRILSRKYQFSTMPSMSQSFSLLYRCFAVFYDYRLSPLFV